MSHYTHGISEMLSGLIDRMSKKEVTKEQVFAVVDSLAAIPISQKQADFFEAIKLLVEKVDAGQYSD